MGEIPTQKSFSYAMMVLCFFVPTRTPLNYLLVDYLGLRIKCIGSDTDNVMLLLELCFREVGKLFLSIPVKHYCTQGLFGNV